MLNTFYEVSLCFEMNKLPRTTKACSESLHVRAQLLSARVGVTAELNRSEQKPLIAA